eukprot:scaffold102346_cov90-Phaeocystis_antarctica.AAC.2
MDVSSFRGASTFSIAARGTSLPHASLLSLAESSAMGSGSDASLLLMYSVVPSVRQVSRSAWSAMNELSPFVRPGAFAPCTVALYKGPFSW